MTSSFHKVISMKAHWELSLVNKLTLIVFQVLNVLKLLGKPELKGENFEVFQPKIVFFDILKFSVELGPK